MANTNKSFKIGAIVLLALFVLAFGAGKYGFLGSIIGGFNDGFIPYGLSSVSLSNKTCSISSSTCTSQLYNWQGDATNHNQLIDGSSVIGSDVSLQASAGKNSKLTIVTTQDFAGRDVKLDIVGHMDPQYNPYGSANGGGSITLPGGASMSFGGNLAQDDSGGLEFKRNIFSNTTTVYWKGQLFTTYPTPKTEHLTFNLDGGAFGGSFFYINNIRYLPTFSCRLSNTDLLASESFVGPKTVSMQPSTCGQTTASTQTGATAVCPRYPIKSFCYSHNAILTDSQQGGSAASAEPYSILLSGSTVPVSGTQTLTLFYVVDNSANLIPTQCSTAQSYNINAGNCTDLTGVVSICSQGILDSTTGLCVVQPSVVCSSGTYNNATNKCEYHSYAPTCDAGYDYNSATSTCEKIPTSFAACTGGRLDLQTSTCIYNPPISKQCTQGTYDNATDSCILRIDTACPAGLVYDSTSSSCKGAPYSGTGTAPTITSINASGTAPTYVSAIPGASIFGHWFGLLILIALLVILYLLIFKKKGTPFSRWLSLQREGIFVGIIIASILLVIHYWLRFNIPVIGWLITKLQELYPFAVVVFVVYLLCTAFGAFSDSKYKPNM